MNFRNTWIWLMLAGILAGIVWIHHYSNQKAQTGPVKVLPGFKAAAVTSVQILRPGQAEIRVERTNSNWRLTQPLAYAAEDPLIEALLAKLEALIPATVIPPSELRNRPKADEEFGFANPYASIVVEQPPDRFRLLLGGKTGPGDQVYCQVVGLDGVYVLDADLLKLVPPNANQWRETALLDLTRLDFDGITVSNAQNLIIQLRREATNGLWRLGAPSPARADNPKIEEALQKLQTTHITQFVSDDPKSDLESVGLQPPSLEMAFTRANNNLLVYQFGKTNNNSQIYAKRFGDSTIVTLPVESVAAWRTSDFRDPHLLAPLPGVDVIRIRGEDQFVLQHETNDTWRVMPQNFEADPVLVKDLLTSLSRLRIDFIKDVVTEPDLPKYGLNAPSRQYVLEQTINGNPSNNVLAVVQFGAQQDNRVYARRTDETSVYAIGTNDFFRLPSANWQFRNRRLWNFGVDDVKGVIINKDGKTCQILRREAAEWVIAPGSQGLVKNNLALEETIRGLTEAAAATWVAQGEQSLPRFGFNAGSLQVTLELKSGVKAAVQFGGEASAIFEYAAVTLEGQLRICEFPWPLFRDLLNWLPIP